jgi:hypothetical protein
MSTEKTMKQLQQEVLANYEEQIAILKSIVESDNKIIELYKSQKDISDKYIQVLKDDVERLEHEVKLLKEELAYEKRNKADRE